MDSIEELRRKNAEQARQIEALRAGQSQYANQAHVLRQQQSMANQGRDPQIDMGANDWWSQLGMQPQQTQPAPQAQTPPPQEERVSLTKAELQAMMSQAARQEYQTQEQQRLQQQSRANEVTSRLQARLVKDNADLIPHAPIIQEVWNAQLAQNPNATPDQLYLATIEKTKSLVQHVAQHVAPQANHPYGGLESQYGPPGSQPWYGAQQQQQPDNLFQDVPGNERPEWQQDVKRRNRLRLSKALNVYAPAPAK